MRTLRVPFVAALIAAAALAAAGTYTIRLSPFPTAEVADGRSQIAVSAQVLDDGRSVPDGTQVVFETDLGSFRESVVRTSGGWARATLVAGGIPGIAHIRATSSSGDAAGSTCEVEFVKSREELSIARETIEAESTGSLVFANDTKILEGVASDKGVTVRYRDLEVHADMVQLDLSRFTLRARKATVRRGRRTVVYESVSFDLPKHTGYGLTNYSATRPDSIVAYPGGVAFTEPTPGGTPAVALPRMHYGMVEVGRERDVPLTHPIDGGEDPFAMTDITNSPSTVGARKVVVYARREVQFHKADIYVNDIKVLKFPLFVVNLNSSTGSPLVTDDILSINNSQIGLNYPQYLTLKPGLTSLVRFRMGQRDGQSFTASRGAFLDYEMNWSKGDDMQGNFLLSSDIGRFDWNASARQFWRLDDRTSASFQLSSPQGDSLFGSGNISHALGPTYSLQLNGTATHSLNDVLNGYGNSQNYSLSLDRNPFRIHDTPLRFGYGLTSVESSTVVPNLVNGKVDGLKTVQDTGVGLTSRLYTDSIVVDKVSSINGSFGATKLYGPETVANGVNLNGQLSYTRKLSSSANALLTYNFLRDGVSELVNGRHSLSLIGNYAHGNTSFRLSGTKGIAVDRLNVAGEASYRLSGLWRLSYTNFTNDSEFGSITQWFTVLSYRIGWREVGVTWSNRSHRPGIQLMNVNL